jgi:hypothetical protein
MLKQPGRPVPVSAIGGLAEGCLGHCLLKVAVKPPLSPAFLPQVGHFCDAAIDTLSVAAESQSKLKRVQRRDGSLRDAPAARPPASFRHRRPFSLAAPQRRAATVVV